MFTRMRICLAMSLVMCACYFLYTAPASHGAPSAQLQAVLDTPLKPMKVRDRSLNIVVGEMMSRRLSSTSQSARPFIGIEYVAGGVKIASFDLPAAPLREQLDEMASAYGYTWEAVGNWINFVPAAKSSDPNYVYNLRIPGKIVLSRDPGKLTPISEWLAEHHIVNFRDLHGLRLVIPNKRGYNSSRVPDPLTLENPTFREYCNAHEALYGCDSWTASVSVRPSQIPGGVPTIVVMAGGSDSRDGEEWSRQNMLLRSGGNGGAPK